MLRQVAYVRTQAKVTLYKTVFRPILTYAVETRVDTAKARKIKETNLRKVTDSSMVTLKQR